ncbi:tRNA (guanosine(37)-N1)-methyltransferase TrmD [bacterium]|nr:tRNA (guanosine(37)-N1)-methyltransferase TrmD [bacterium]
MRIGVVTLFPEWFSAARPPGVVGRAIERGLVAIETANPREFTTDKHRTVDDTVFGGGPGMVLRPEPLAAAIRDMRVRVPGAPVLALSPGGEPFTDAVARRLAAASGVILVCGRYEGIDQRVIEACCDGELSIGDFVLTGGEIAALAVIEAVARLQPGVVGKEGNVAADSFAAGLAPPVYTRPEEWEGQAVPDVLRSGDAARIAAWRREAAIARTNRFRPAHLIDAARETLVLVLTGEDAVAAIRFARAFVPDLAAHALLVSPDADARAVFRDAHPAFASSSPREVGERVTKLVGAHEAIDLADAVDVGATRLRISCAIADGKGAALIADFARADAFVLAGRAARLLG